MDDAIEFEVEEIVAETEMAVLFRLADVEEPVWIPKSQIRDEWDDGVILERWICEQKGIG